MNTAELPIQVDADRRVTGALHRPAGGGDPVVAVALAHGAGNDMDHPLLTHLAAGLAGAGHAALRFNFPYREQGRKSPDGQKVLEATWLAAAAALREALEPTVPAVLAAGKSMGGRVASQLAADGRLAVDGLVLLGYPLHAPGKKDRPRDAHLYALTCPLLFFNGTRDSLCDRPTLERVLAAVSAPWELEVIEGGDHSFRLPKGATLSPREVDDQILDVLLRWLDAGW